MKKRRILLFLAILLLLGLFILYDNRFNPSVYRAIAGFYHKEITVTENVAFENENVPSSTAFRNDLVYYSSSGLRSSSGWEYDLRFVNPKLQSSGGYLLAFDRGATEMAVFRNYKLAYSIKDTREIINAKVNRSGYTALVTKELGYRGKVTVYNKRGNEIYKFHSGEKYIMDADFSPDGKRMAVCMLDTSQDSFVSSVAFFNLKEDKPTVTYEDTQGSFTNVRYFSGNRVIAVGNKLTAGFDSSGQKVWDYEYHDAMLQSYSMNSNKAIVLGLRQHNQKIVILTADGKIYEYVCDTNAEVSKVDINENAVMAVTSRDVLFLNRKGFFIASQSFNRDIKDIHIGRSGIRGMVLYHSNFDFVKVK